MPFRYPPARVDPVVDLIHGVPVPDPYRWLEDAGSEETRAWVDAQNAFTRAALDGPARDALIEELTARFNYPRTLAIQVRGDRFFFTRNPGLLNQPILYVQDEDAGEPRVLLDPNQLSADGTTAMTAFFPSPDGALVAYAISQHGSDRQIVKVRDVGTGQDLEDRLEWVKFASIAWSRHPSAFYYLRFPEPGTVAPEDEQYFGRIYFHRLGTRQSQDALVFERPGDKEVVPLVHVTHDDRFVVITAQRGASDDSEVYLVDRAEPGIVRPVFTGFDAAYEFIQSSGNRLLFRTTRDAPMGRIVAVEADDAPARLHEVVPEADHRLSNAVISRDGLYVVYLANASDRLERFDLNGGRLGSIDLPEIGSIVTIDGQPDYYEAALVFTSFTSPPRPFRTVGGFRLQAEDPVPSKQPDAPTSPDLPAKADLPDKSDLPANSDLPAKAGSHLQISSRAYVTRQVWYESKDGTRVSMFLVHRADLPRDGQRRVLLSGYGGFNINRTPAYDPGNFPLLDRGGIFALANLRGGGEYGEAWHRAGMLERKQNVFDDFIAAAEYLIREGYTRPERLAIEGGSNGGLLVGAVMTQRPDLFGAVLCRVPVADMLRYHLFTIGRFWIPEYGSAEDPDQFAYLLRYSPYHNVRDGLRYPRTMIMTAPTRSPPLLPPSMASRSGRV